MVTVDAKSVSMNLVEEIYLFEKKLVLNPCPMFLTDVVSLTKCNRRQERDTIEKYHTHPLRQLSSITINRLTMALFEKKTTHCLII